MLLVARLSYPNFFFEKGSKIKSIKCSLVTFTTGKNWFDFSVLNAHMFAVLFYVILICWGFFLISLAVNILVYIVVDLAVLD